MRLMTGSKVMLFAQSLKGFVAAHESDLPRQR
jgi:hypothetical protein